MSASRQSGSPRSRQRRRYGPGRVAQHLHPERLGLPATLAGVAGADDGEAHLAQKVSSWRSARTRGGEHVVPTDTFVAAGALKGMPRAASSP